MNPSVLKNPGTMQTTPGPCCLVCALQDVGVGKLFITAAVLARTNVEGVLKDSFVRHLIDEMTPSKRKAVLAVFDSLIKLKGMVVHSMYFQRQSLPVIFGEESANYRFDIGHIDKGQILEVFQSTDASLYAHNVLGGLITEGVELDWQKLGVQWIRNCYLSTVVWISTTDSTMTYFWHDGKQLHQKSLPVGRDSNTLDELFQEIRAKLKSIRSVSVIIVNKINFKDFTPSVQQWINFFASVYGDTAGSFLVLTVVYQDYLKHDVFSKVQVQKMVNWDLLARENVKCVDFSSVIDQLPDEQGHVNMHFFSPPQ